MVMETQNLVLFLCFSLLSLLSGFQGATASHHHHHHNHHHHHHHHHRRHQRYLYGFKPTKLFVFGDSYVDTGNIQKSLANSWKFPYGMTFPGKPAGRFSDGRVLTDYLAKFVGIKSPIAYKWKDMGGQKLMKNGMNFAYGGTGVFNTFVQLPNMTTQIDFFQNLLIDSVYTSQDVQSSIAVVTVAGNDYGAFLATNASFLALQSFIPLVVNQLAINMKRIHAMGVKKVAVTSLEPLGCLPRSTVVSSFQTCNATENTAVNFHNLLLQQAVAKLNNETNDSTFVIIDLYASFMSVFKKKGDDPGSAKFENPLKPCCVGISNEYSCGSMDEKGMKKYTICDDPQSTFFWDGSHPSQEGWSSVYSALKSNLDLLY